jgi:hypothetical protein
MKIKNNRDVIALFVADLHLSLTPPPFRSAEPDWIKAQQRPLDELRALQLKHDCPVFYEGDIFDRWNSVPELINWAIAHLPHGYAIPGQHDLPEHDLEQIERSAYWTLVKANVIHNMQQGDPGHDIFIHNKEVVFHPFPFGVKIKKPKSSSHFSIALIHEYNWVSFHVYDNKGTTTELQSQHVNSSRKEFKGYDLVVSGDNHSPFNVQIGKTQFWNCGTFMRRKSDERD